MEIWLEDLFRSAFEAHQAGQWSRAEALYHQILEQQPGLPAPHAQLALIYHAHGRIDRAVQHVELAIQGQGNHPGYYGLLGDLRLNQQQFAEAVAAYRQAIERAPLDPQLHYKLGCALHEAQAQGLAIIAYRFTLALQPDLADAANNLGIAYQESGQLNEAIQAYQTAIAARPNFSAALTNLGIALQKAEHWELARQSFEQALQWDPNHGAAWNGLGGLALAMGQPQTAIGYFEKVRQLQPQYADAYYNLGLCFQACEQGEQAAQAFYQAAHLDRKYSPILYIQQLQSLGYWQGLEEQARQAIAQLQQGIADQTLVPVSPFLLMTLPVETTPSQQLACARYWSQKTFQGIPQLTRKRRPRASKIRLAYISPDFRSHPGATLVPELFENHDRRAFEVIAYALGPDDQSPFRQRIVQACDRFVDLHGATATASALRIAEDAVDILVDLSGYTQHTKANVLAMRPAPVQVNYLGYPGTMGADFIDYILADDYVIPPSETCYFQEKVVYLPGAYQVNTPNWQVSPPPTREQAGLPPHGFVFCCFHASYKITLPIYRCWLRLLQAIPGSVLWLLQSPPSMVQNLQALAAKAGIDPHRIIFAPRLPLPEHFARHRLADLFLDCYPVNAHTTASDALRMGLPLVTLSGPSFISRVAGSLLRTVGLPELITHDLASYEAVALELARQPQRLQAIQDRLPQLVANSSLFDIQHATCKLEAAFQAMYANDLQGFPPRAFRISEQFQAIFPP